ncbi:serine/threonine-protein kinase [Caballeronia grimmiae]|uniref:hypothetical protein n=1 Tax=Caballeronia grimmiae TaxID=1071679 RepID=UPI0038B949AA
MSDRFDNDAMGDLFYETAEGPSQYEGFEDDGFDEGDQGDDDEFTRVVTGAGVGNGAAVGADEFDEMEDLGDMDAGGEWDSPNSFEDAVADALEAEDADEFFRRLRRIARSAANVARSVGRGVGQVARVVGPIASAIPLPQAQAIGRVANIAGRLLADGADEFEALDELIDWAEEEDNLDAAAPVIAGLALRRNMPGVSRLPQPARRRLVRGVTQATRTLARRQGPQAARAIPRIVQNAQRAVRQRRIPARALAQVVRQTAARVAANPQAARRLSAPLASGGGFARPGASGGGSCPHCGRRRTIVMRGPVRLTIHAR